MLTNILSLTAKCIGLYCLSSGYLGALESSAKCSQWLVSQQKRKQITPLAVFPSLPSFSFSNLFSVHNNTQKQKSSEEEWSRTDIAFVPRLLAHPEEWSRTDIASYLSAHREPEYETGNATTNLLCVHTHTHVHEPQYTYVHLVLLVSELLT